jgi:hypothetical protein
MRAKLNTYPVQFTLTDGSKITINREYTQREAVFKACEKLADLSSVDELVEAASKIYGREVGYQACVTYRGEYRKANGLSHNDCRTNESQYRRNMLNDHRVTETQITRWRHYNNLTNRTAAAYTRLIGEGEDKIHSIEHLSSIQAEARRNRKLRLVA